MSVYTSVESAQLARFLEHYRLGKALDLRPIAAGITNSNFYLDTDQGEFVLTLYEQHGDDDLDYMLGLQQHLAQKFLPCPNPAVDRRGEFYGSLNQRPAAIIQRLPGEVVATPKLEHCEQIGEGLARFHLAGIDFAGHRPNPRSLDWIVAVRDMLDPELDFADRKLISATLQDMRSFDVSALPSGAIHADLFHDNVLFDKGRLCGIIDFDYACRDSFVFDLAVLINDWCIDAVGDIEAARVAAVLGAYQQQRRLQQGEFDALSLMLRLTCLRFWLSRLYDLSFPLSGELTFSKNPGEFRDMLELRSAKAAELEALFLPHFMG